MKKVALGILMASLLAACASQKPKEQPVAEQVTPSATEAAAPMAVDALNDPNSPLAKRSVYYPFDVSVVQSEDRPLVAAHAKYLSEHPETHVRVEGNCDERGSTEYNLALGQRRADGVERLLMIGGAKAGQITTVSYGEEKPRLTCHAEKCWKENRRTDLDYGAK